MIPRDNGQRTIEWRGMKLRLTIAGGYITYARELGGARLTWIAGPE